MGIYISETDVEVRLIGKVRFTDDLDEENKMPRVLLRKLIAEAESQVENDLSPRYMAPFQTEAGTAFKYLPERPTRSWLRTMCELMAVMRVLETDFGSGSAVNGKEYFATQEERYNKMKNQLLERHSDSYRNWFYPPLPSLRLNYFNTAADDGYAGQIMKSGEDNDGAYPQKQINDPAETYWNGELDL